MLMMKRTMSRSSMGETKSCSSVIEALFSQLNWGRTYALELLCLFLGIFEVWIVLHLLDGN